MMGRESESYRKFYEEVGEKYPEETIVYRSLRGRLRKAFILKRLSSWKGRFLDVGCNQGMYLREYEGGWKVGMDISYPVLRKIRNENGVLSLVVADAQCLDCFRACTFDGILCSEVLEHVKQPIKVLEGLIRLLKPGGRVLVTVPNYRGRRPEWVEIGTMRGYGIHGVRGESYYHTAFRPEELEKMGRRAGFEIIETGTLEKEVKYAAKIPFMLFVMFHFLNRKTFRNQRWALVNQRMYDALTNGIYALVRGVGFNRLLVNWISEGVRSYALFKKPIT